MFSPAIQDLSHAEMQEHLAALKALCQAPENETEDSYKARLKEIRGLLLSVPYPAALYEDDHKKAGDFCAFWLASEAAGESKSQTGPIDLLGEYTLAAFDILGLTPHIRNISIQKTAIKSGKHDFDPVASVRTWEEGTSYNVMLKVEEAFKLWRTDTVLTQIERMEIAGSAFHEATHSEQIIKFDNNHVTRFIADQYRLIESVKHAYPVYRVSLLERQSYLRQHVFSDAVHRTPRRPEKAYIDKDMGDYKVSKCVQALIKWAESDSDLPPQKAP